MTNKTEALPEALRLAANLRRMHMLTINCMELRRAAYELEKSHAEILQLKAQLSARQAAPTGLTEAVFQVLEGWNIPAPVRKILETAYYAPPPPEREPLTTSQLSEVMESVDYTWEPTRFARAIERAHGIGATND